MTGNNPEPLGTGEVDLLAPGWGELKGPADGDGLDIDGFWEFVEVEGDFLLNTGLGDLNGAGELAWNKQNLIHFYFFVFEAECSGIGLRKPGTEHKM